MAASRAEPKKRPLSRRRILRAAVRHADKHGMDGLNMRQLADVVGSGVMSLYNHVADKGDLVDGMIELVAEEIPPPPQGEGWRTATSEIAVSAHRVLTRHHWVGARWSNRGAGPAKLAHLESIVRVLREAGFSVALACRGYHAVTMHIVGFTLQALEFPTDARSMKSAANAFLGQADADRVPYFVEHVRYHLENPEPTDQFGFMLEMILDGLEKQLALEAGRAEK